MKEVILYYWYLDLGCLSFVKFILIFEKQNKEKKITLIFFFRTRKELKYLSKISSCHSWLVETSLKYGILSTQWDYYHQYCQHKEELHQSQGEWLKIDQNVLLTNMGDRLFRNYLSTIVYKEKKKIFRY